MYDDRQMKENAPSLEPIREFCSTLICGKSKKHIKNVLELRVSTYYVSFYRNENECRRKGEKNEQINISYTTMLKNS